ncbi:MAG TPA: hypothetical protein VGD67_27565 [Pseudonocardiaceae bacterium]
MQPTQGPCLARAARREFGRDEAGPPDPKLPGFVRDLVRPYGNAPREELLTVPAGHAYADLAEPLIGEVVLPGGPVDLLVLVSGIHDVQLARPTAAYLSHVCPGRPISFAVCDQGSAGPFTALRLLREHIAAGDARRALLVVAEQPTLHYEPAPGPGVVPTRAAAVALLFEPGDGLALTAFRQHARVPAADADALVRQGIADLAGDHEDVTVVLGHGLSPDLATTARPVSPVAAPSAGTGTAPSAGPGPEARRAPAGLPFTGVWWELAGLLDGPVPPGRVLLADHDPDLGYVCLAALDPVRVPVAAAPSAAPSAAGRGGAR